MVAREYLCRSCGNRFDRIEIALAPSGEVRKWCPCCGESAEKTIACSCEDFPRECSPTCRIHGSTPYPRRS